MTETKGKYKVHKNWGGTRIAGEGKKIGKPAEIGSNGKRYQDYLDDETIAILAQINNNRSEAIRVLARKYQEQTL